MTRSLPDISLNSKTHIHTPINWVGMDAIDLPLCLAQEPPHLFNTLSSQACFQVDMGAANSKGIHMSRLYQLLSQLAELQPLTPASLLTTLEQGIQGQQEAQASQARLILRFNLLLKRPALLSPGLGGWKSYPVQLHAQLSPAGFTLTAEVKVGYSSTCPCSAALARQLLAQHFNQAFAATEQCSVEQVAHWLQEHGSFATPHSQRSQATVTVTVPQDAAQFALVAIIDRIEAALSTPLQTAVKRIDEQEFARLNGQNLIFVEDAVRRLQQALSGHYKAFSASARHLESLHAHDALASIEQDEASDCAALAR
ncbi:MAG: GTP cyclohydrolase FolE2 [Pseudomonas sp.]|nr:GTP cyclohydrolase FolE2 [Pseudomonas sp.]